MHATPNEMYCRTSKNQDSVWLRIDWSPCVTKKVSICSTFAVLLLQLNGLCIQSRLSSASYVDLLLANLTAPFSAFTDSKGSLIAFDTRWSRCDATHDSPDSVCFSAVLSDEKKIGGNYECKE